MRLINIGDVENKIIFYIIKIKYTDHKKTKFAVRKVLQENALINVSNVIMVQLL